MEEEYLGYLLYGDTESSQGRDGIGYYVAVYKAPIKDSELIFYESTFMSGTKVAITYGSRKSVSSAITELERITFSRAKARIALEYYEPGGKYNKNIFTGTAKPETVEVSDKKIENELLRTLLNIRRWNPLIFKELQIDPDGFCDLLQINRDRYSYVGGLLVEDGFISTGDVEELDIDNGGIYITSKGTRYFHTLSENVAQVSESYFNKYKRDGSVGEFKYDIAISFAGSERQLAEELADILKNSGYKVFYDKDYQAELWGKDLVVEFEEIFRIQSRLCVIFVSDEYKNRMWTKHEISSALSRAVQERGKEYILPVRVDDTDIPGLHPTIGYLHLREYSIASIAEILIRKLNEFK